MSKNLLSTQYNNMDHTHKESSIMIAKHSLLIKIYDLYIKLKIVCGEGFYLEDDCWNFYQGAESEKEILLLSHLLEGNLKDFISQGEELEYEKLITLFGEVAITVSSLLTGMVDKKYLPYVKKFLGVYCFACFADLMVLASVYYDISTDVFEFTKKVVEDE